MNDLAQKTGAPNAGSAGTPAHQVIYGQLRELILFGEIAPGEAVTIQGLCTRLGAGMTPVREAIRRLISEGALQFQGNRRVTVPQLTAANVTEIIFARQWLESHLALRATERATAEDLTHLARIDAALDAAIEQGELHAYLRQNYRFHERIYHIADAPILAEMAERLWLRFGPSLRVMIGRVGTQNQPDKHRALMDCMRTGDAEGAARAMREDMLQGMEHIRAMLERGARNG
ncbi:DNA-binding transcriptional regulator, GntR family [Lutimaribacter pacificus]|uniref:Transcriptional regulator, GntR family n=1 Tax=Lutimaribacter pacificus TaxID=391948 RepID=A0A1H0FZV4_9RHOB|nr:GntR family transcriptional regulator [Lutimaribacter pacificus]SDO00187.1 DNA-binding transcriptional regulator, GntR family [Lutimaribacter pacificus]SHJ83447.1 transcriptional regulator, GntR family [Lutimaribacter pacificus]